MILSKALLSRCLAELSLDFMSKFSAQTVDQQHSPKWKNTDDGMRLACLALLLHKAFSTLCSLLQKEAETFPRES